MTATTWREGAWMQTYSGRQFWPLDPRPEDIDLDDIAHALSRICRYGGHVHGFYSVAEHCVQLSRWFTDDRDLALWALMHDAAEAYVGDMVRPLKHHMPAFQEAEDRILAAIAVRFDLPHREGLIPAAVHEADNRILLDERAALLTHTEHAWAVEHLQPLDVPIVGWPNWVAEVQFRQRFQELTA